MTLVEALTRLLEATFDRGHSMPLGESVGDYPNLDLDEERDIILATIAGMDARILQLTADVAGLRTALLAAAMTTKQASDASLATLVYLDQLDAQRAKDKQP